MNTAPKDMPDESASFCKISLTLPFFSADTDTGPIRVELDDLEDQPAPSPFSEVWDSNCACT